MPKPLFTRLRFDYFDAICQPFGAVALLFVKIETDYNSAVLLAQAPAFVVWPLQRD